MISHNGLNKDSRWTPEVYFLIFAFWWALSPFLTSQHLTTGDIKYPAYILALVLMLQFYVKSRALGLIVSGILTLYFSYLILALLSDFADNGSIRFLVLGGLLIAISIMMSILMFLKYRHQIQQKTNVPTI
ncbi:MAG: hypothetical protein WD824_24770 [Cyclobacteriaceae bacterium]